LATIQDSFEALLTWLDPDDRDAAGRAYELIRAGLIQTSVSRGFSNAEELADETIKRVTRRVLEIAPDYEGEPAKYFYGVLRNVMKERRLKREFTTDDFPVPLVDEQKTSDAYDCLVSCLSLLPREKTEFILEYYTYEGSNKVRSHAKMAADRGISENAVRMRAFHLRNKLEQCVRECLSGIEIKKPRTPLESRIGQRKTEPRA
jgi:DNA-directed RNA polymerase specialized sigma24 family protein